VSTLKSSAENLTLNADGSGNDVIIQSNGSTLVTVDGSQSSVGIGTATPTGNAKLHIYNGASGQASSSNNTEVVVENSSNTGIHFLTPNTAVSGLWFGDPEDNDVGRMYYSHSDDSLQIFTDTEARVRIDSDGIKFGTDTAAANALNDYEEGNHACAFTSDSGSITVGRNDLAYTKIGNIVHMTGEIGISSVSSPNGTKMSLPFTVASHTNDRNMNWGGQGMICYSIAQHQDNPPCLYSSAGESHVNLLYQQDDGAFIGYDAAAGDTYMFSFTYKTDS